MAIDGYCMSLDTWRLPDDAPRPAVQRRCARCSRWTVDGEVHVCVHYAGTFELDPHPECPPVFDLEDGDAD